MQHKQFLVTIFLLFGIGISGVIGQLNHLFTVQKIQCSIDQQQACPDFLQAELQKNIGKPIFLTNFSGQLQRIATVMPSFHRASYEQQLPDTVLVHFLTAQPQYAVKSQTGNSVFIVDDTGTLIDQASQTNLPVLILPESMSPLLELRAQLPSSLHQANQILFAGLQQHGLKVSAVTALSSTELTMLLPNQVLAHLSTEHLSQQLNKLAYILSSNNLTTIKAPIKEIDLRFRYPVIKT